MSFACWLRVPGWLPTGYAALKATPMPPIILLQIRELRIIEPGRFGLGEHDLFVVAEILLFGADMFYALNEGLELFGRGRSMAER